jgi:hypothetical protein
MRRSPKTRSLVLLAAFSLGRVSNARAEPLEGGHSRFAGDIDVSASLGAALAKGGPSAALSARIFYLETAGLYAGYTDALSGDASEPRSLALGIALRPLFLTRWGSDLEHGPGWLDLTVDSLTLDLGAFWSQRAGDGVASAPGLEAAIGMETPLLGHAAGPFLGLRGTLRWDASELAAPNPDRAVAAALVVALSWHFVASTHVVDLGDAELR